LLKMSQIALQFLQGEFRTQKSLGTFRISAAQGAKQAIAGMCPWICSKKCGIHVYGCDSMQHMAVRKDGIRAPVDHNFLFCGFPMIHLHTKDFLPGFLLKAENHSILCILRGQADRDQCLLKAESFFGLQYPSGQRNLDQWNGTPGEEQTFFLPADEG